jgi:phage terminase large subunit-like protein
VTPEPCLFTYDGNVCDQVGSHFCVPRADHAQAFFEEVLLHTKGTWSRKPFKLAPWQRDELIRPIFGKVHFSDEWSTYVRTTRIVWIELARKQGKSEMLAGIALYLLCADNEEGAEIYGAAMDRDQARKVYDVAARMVRLSPVLSKRLTVRDSAKRIVDEQTASYYEAIPADAGGNLGHNPHGIVFDEILTQKNGDLWDALRTGMGTRTQPLMVAATTPGNDPAGWCGQMHLEMERVAEDPERAPHILVFLRNLPMDSDPFDESNWAWPNPALGDFLSMQAIRDEAIEARNDPAKENAYRQFRMAQWVRQAFRWMQMHLWDDCIGEPWPRPSLGRERLSGRSGWCGLDLAAKSDLTAWCILIPEGVTAANAGQRQLNGVPLAATGKMHALWRFWIPEEALAALDDANDGQYTRWARDGWLTVTEGNVVDYDRIYADIAADAKTFKLRAGDADQWSMAPVIQEIEKRTGIEEFYSYPNTYNRMTPGMDELMGFVKAGQLQHHGNPVARACFDAVEVVRAPYDPDLIRPVKPERSASSSRIDGVPALAMAAAAWRRTATVERRKTRVYGF